MKKENSFKFRKVFVVVCCLMFIFPLGNNGILVSVAQDYSSDIGSTYIGNEYQYTYAYTNSLLYDNSTIENGYRDIFTTGSFNEHMYDYGYIMKIDYQPQNSSSHIVQLYMDDNINDVLDLDYDTLYNNSAWNFDNFSIDETWDNIDFIDSQLMDKGLAELTIVKTDLYEKSLVLVDTSTTGTERYSHILENESSNGVVEFYWYATSNKIREFHILDEIWQNSIRLRWDNLYKLSYDFGTGYNEIFTYEINEWYHYRIQWNCSIDKFFIWINNVSIDGGVGYDFYGNPIEMDTLWFSSQSGTIGNVYFDCIDFSFSSGYYENRNNESILVLNDQMDLMTYFSYTFDDSTNINSYLYFSKGKFSFTSDNAFFSLFGTYNFTYDYIESLEIEFQSVLYYDFIDDINVYLNRWKITVNNTLFDTLFSESTRNHEWICTNELDDIIMNNLNENFNINCLYGIRSIYKDLSLTTSSIIDIPNYMEFIEFEIPETPEFYDETKYWSYITFQLEEDFTENVSFSQEIKIGNELKLFKFAYNFTHTKAVIFNAKYNYYDEVIKNRDWGNWGIFNWVRNGLVAVVNGLLLGIQFIGFLIVAGVSILFGGLFIALIIPFVWNILLYYVLFALVWVLFYLWIGLSYLVGWFIYLLKPFFSFLFTVVIPFLIYLLIELFSWILALLLWVITLGSANLNDLYMIINTFLTNIADFFISALSELGNYLPELFTYFSTYVILVGLCFIKLEYTQAKGIVNRSNQLSSSLNAYMIPIKIGSSLVLKIKNILFGWI